jgi:hypothetical protein
VSTDDHKASPEELAASFRMTDLEEALFGPGGADRAKELLGRIDRLLLELDAEIRAGMPPDRFEKSKVVANALAAARDLLLRITTLLQRG